MSGGFTNFIANKLLTSKVGSRKLSGPVVAVATMAVALGVAIMIVAVAIGLGFKHEVRDKIVGFGTHIQIVSLDFNRSYETTPIKADSTLEYNIAAIEGVRHLQPFVLKPGIIKTAEEIQGIALKGIDASFDTTFLASCLEEGRMIHIDTARSNDIYLSREIANMLKLNVGDAVRMYFVGGKGLRARKFTLCGIFNSHFSEFDHKIAFVDIRQLQMLNNWADNQISGYEVIIDDFDNLDNVAKQVSAYTSMVIGPDDVFLHTQSITEMQPQMFGWLALLDMNIAVILVLIISVACLNMVSGLLILILENTNTIGLLKAIGCRGRRIRRIFLVMAMHIVGRGMIIGNIIGITICAIQALTGVVKLNPENYYLDTVPIMLPLGVWAALNIGAFLFTTLMMVAPSHVISRITPAKALRFN